MYGMCAVEECFAYLIVDGRAVLGTGGDDDVAIGCVSDSTMKFHGTVVDFRLV